MKREMALSSLNTISGLTLIVVEMKRGADVLEAFLIQLDYPSTSIHEDLTQTEREGVLHSFRSGRTPIMVATDVAASALYWSSESSRWHFGRRDDRGEELDGYEKLFNMSLMLPGHTRVAAVRDG